MSRLLLIEDESEDALLYRTRFELGGFKVSVARTAEDGFVMAKKETPDIIVLDLVLGDHIQLKSSAEVEYAGMKLLSRLVTDPATGNIPVVVLTNLDKDVFAPKARAAGARDFMSKSDLLPEEVVSRIQDILA